MLVTSLNLGVVTWNNDLQPDIRVLHVDSFKQCIMIYRVIHNKFNIFEYQFKSCDWSVFNLTPGNIV